MTMAPATQPAAPPAPSLRGQADRSGRIAYAAMASGLAFYVLTIWIQVYIDTRQARPVGVDPRTEAHRHWRLRSSLLFLVWSVLGILTVPLGVGWLILAPAWVWYAYRIARGAWRYRQGRAPAVAASRGRA